MAGLSGEHRRQLRPFSKRVDFVEKSVKSAPSGTLRSACYTPALMATRYASLSGSARCPDLSERDLIAALISRDECAALLTRIAEMPSRRSTTRALLALIGRLATPACTWLEGELAVEIYDDSGGTKLSILSELGNLRERVLPTMILALSFADVLAAVEKRRDLMALLRIERVSSRCVLLLASEEDAPSSEFDISETSLAMAWPAPPGSDRDVDSGWDDSPN
jgi:hypothetical protein